VTKPKSCGAPQVNTSINCRPTPSIIDSTLVEPVKSTHDLSVYVDCDLLMRTRVQCTVSRCFAVLRLLRQIRHSVLTETFRMLVVSLVLTWLDFGNSGVPDPLTPVSVECGSTIDMTPPPIRPHHWCVSLSALAARPEASSVQDRRPGIQSLARTSATISRTTQSRCWPAWPVICSFCRHYPSGNATHQAVNCRQSCFPGCGRTYVERTSCLLSHCLHSTSDWRPICFQSFPRYILDF